MLGIFLQVLDIEGCACNRVYNPVTLLTLPHCQHEVTEYKGLKNPKPTTTKTTRKSLPPPPPAPSSMFWFQQLGCVFCNITNFLLAVVREKSFYISTF